MIVKAENKHISDICELWHEAFGDEHDIILEYLDFLLPYIYVAEIDGKAVSMATAIPVTFRELCGRYVYAVATKKELRGQGLGSEILNFLKESRADFLVLVPAEKSLFEYYENRGFYSSNMKLKKDIYKAKETNVEAVKVSPKEYLQKRRKYKENVIAFDEQTLAFAGKMYDGEFLKTETGIAFCFCHGKKVIVKEILAEDASKTLDAICAYYGKKIAEYAVENYEGQEFFMTYPKLDVYFNIAMD